MIESGELRKFYLFDKLSDSDISEILPCLENRSCRRGECIIRAGDINECLYLIKSGQVSISRAEEDSQDKILSVLTAGECFGEMSIITNEKISANVVSMLDTQLLVLRKTRFLKLLEKYPSIALNLSLILSKRLRHSNKGPETSPAIALSSILTRDLPLAGELAAYAFAVGETFSSGCRKPVLLLFSPEEDSILKLPCKYLKTMKLSAQQASKSVKTSIYSDSLHIGFLAPSADINDTLTTLLKEYSHVINIEILPAGKHSALLENSSRVILFTDGRNMALYAGDDEKYAGALTIAGKGGALDIRRNARKFTTKPILSYDTGGSSARAAEIIRAARFLKNKTVGLVFGGGGARGFAHIGVMKVLEENAIEPDVYCGSSMGAVVAALYAMGYKSPEVYDIMKKQWTKKGAIYDFNFPFRSILKSKKLKKMAKEAYGNTTFKDLPYKLYVVCADLVSGNEIIIEHGLLRRAVYASGALPGILTPVRMGEKYLVDGGILNKVPASVLKARDISNIIAVNVTPQRDDAFLNRKSKKPGG
ncbi:MAG: patatin-like phospholipase family protein, partial [Candidatus Aureabacteria bacterium]|nr:patatin-like phospholipase family protein [Candidatus Auribacterota bacterium]